MWTALIPVLGGLLDKLIPDPQASAAAKLKMLEMAQGDSNRLHQDLKLWPFHLGAVLSVFSVH